MASSVDAQVELLVRQHVHEPILATGWFHVVGPEPAYRGVSEL